MELTKAEQKPEAHAFLYKRTEAKFHYLESVTVQIAESETEQARDRIEAMRFLRQLYVDQYSLFLYGPSHFLTRELLSAKPFTDEIKECVTLQAQYIYDEYGKFPATIPSIFLLTYLQAQHIDLDLYDHYFRLSEVD
jgi:hypothetical protein